MCGRTCVGKATHPCRRKLKRLSARTAAPPPAAATHLPSTRLPRPVILHACVFPVLLHIPATPASCPARTPPANILSSCRHRLIGEVCGSPEQALLNHLLGLAIQHLPHPSRALSGSVCSWLGAWQSPACSRCACARETASGRRRDTVVRACRCLHALTSA